MCLLGIEFGRFKDFPVLVLANREELYARPSTGPSLFPRERENPAWMGGVDLVAGGTWLGLNEYGLLVAVTNRKKREPPANPPSRGLLCRKLLSGRDTESVAEAALHELQGNRFAGCNLLIADRDSVCVIEAGDALQVSQLPPGLHLLANAELNDPADRRIERVRREFARANSATAEAWFHTARHVCQLTGLRCAPPHLLVWFRPWHRLVRGTRYLPTPRIVALLVRPRSPEFDSVRRPHSPAPPALRRPAGQAAA